jgi:outer membrane receptor protein involved in Fe transport
MFSDIFQTELSAAAQKARGQMSLDDTHNDQYYENIANTISYKPETSWNYEVGTHLNLFNHALHFDVAAYYMQVKNQQLSVMAGNYGFGRMMVNAGKSHSCGVETTLRGNVFDNHLSWAVSYGYTRALFDDYVDSVSVGGKKKAVDYKDKYVPYVPQHTYAVMADYTFDVQNSKLRTITLGFNLNGQGKTYWDEENTSEQKLYHVLGAHADADFGFMKISFWGKNLTNTKYNTFAVESAATGKKYTFAQLGNPFQCGVDLKFHF